MHRNSSRQSGRLLRLCLGAACTGCIDLRDHFFIRCDLCLGAACTGCIPPMEQIRLAVGMPLPRRCLHGVHHNKGALFQRALSLPRRCLHGVHHIQLHHAGAVRSFASALPARGASPRLESRSTSITLCLGAACTGCIGERPGPIQSAAALPRRCLHGVHPTNQAKRLHFLRLCLGAACTGCIARPPRCTPASSALPRRCLHGVHLDCRGFTYWCLLLCLGAACTGCIAKRFLQRYIWLRFASALPARGASLRALPAARPPSCFASALPARGASAKADKLRHTIL